MTGRGPPVRSRSNSRVRGLWFRPMVDPVEALLVAADAAAANGRALVAADELSLQDRHFPDSRLERRIVELRHLAFDQLERVSGRPSWPLRLADPFPGVDGLPETTADRLSGDLLGGAIVNHGCFRVSGLIDHEVVDRLRHYIERSFEARERLEDGESGESADLWLVPFELGREKAEGFCKESFIRVVDVPRALCELVDVYTRTGVHRAVSEYFNERPAMIANKWTLRRTPNGKSGTDLHQDGAFLGEGIRTVSCWISLSHCGPNTGRPGLDLIPRRFDTILAGGEKAAFPWSLPEEVALDAACGAPIIGPVFEPGDAMFFDERLPHRTSVGSDLKPRYAIESWFVAPSSYPTKQVPIVI